MIALIDADLVAFRCAASAENDSADIAILRADKLMQQLLDETYADQYRAFLTGSSNFRKEIDPEYKANRTQPPPQYLTATREFLVTEWKASVTDGHEADDELGLSQVKGETIICSLDKDLLQIPGSHYRWAISGPNWTKEAQLLVVEEFDGLLHFYTSSLVGDRTDNIIGVEGIGPVRAKKALADCRNEQELFDRCRSLYNDDNRYFKNLKLLWIWRELGDVFDPVKRGLIENTPVQE